MPAKTYTELIVLNGRYVEVESVREPGTLKLVSQQKTGNAWELHQWREAIAEMNRRNAEREKAERERRP